MIREPQLNIVNMKKLSIKILSAFLFVTLALPALAQMGPTTYRVDDFDDLVAITLYGADPKGVAFVGGDATRNDGFGSVFYYNGTSTLLTNVYSVLRPTFLAGGAAGRWIMLSGQTFNQNAVATAASESTYAVHLLRNNSTNVFALGADNNNVYLQSWANYALHLNNTGNNTILNATAGNVGVGTASPGAKLHSLSTTEQLRLGYDASNYNSFTVGSAGSLTIAAVGTNPSITLTPAGTGNTYIGGLGVFTANSSAAANVPPAAGLAVGYNPGGEAEGAIIWGTQTFATSPLIFSTWNGTIRSEKVRISSAGNVGVGTTGPTTLLSVNGATGTSTLAVTNAATVGTLAVGGGAVMTAILSVAAQLDFPSIPATAVTNLTITVTGATTNSTVIVSGASGQSIHAAGTNLVYSAFVGDVNTVHITAANATTAAIDPPTASYRVTVFNY